MAEKLKGAQQNQFDTKDGKTYHKINIYVQFFYVLQVEMIFWENILQ